jgi:hypothetical protein
MAQKPITFNFKMIKKAISDTSALKAKALKEYEMKTKIYYDKVGDALLKAGLGANFHTKQHRTEQERRTAVDKAVEDARMIARGGESNAAIQELLRLEQSLRDIILNPARQIYEAKLQAAKAQIDKAINNMIASKLAVYLNANEKKIEAIVNLQDESSQ